jgi:hypothetical protein
MRESDDKMTKTRTILAMIAVAAGIAMFAPAAIAQDNFNRKTVITFSKPFEVPGMVLPAGTYTFQLADTLVDRHIVSISSADGKQQIAMAMGIAVNRVDTTTKTVITFNEVAPGAPETIRTWFYPGRNAGVEFVYPKQRALELAAISKVIVPAIAVDAPQADLKTVPIVAVTPELREVPVTAIAEIAPRLEQTQASARLPKTADSLYLVTFGGLLAFCAATALLVIRKSANTPTA